MAATSEATAYRADFDGVKVDDKPVGGAGEIVPVTAVAHRTRFLRVANISGDTLTLYVQYYTQDADGKWAWFPGAPDKAEPLSIELAQGETADVLDNNWHVNASRVRIWAKAANGKEWNKFKTTDLDLVPETDAGGMPAYLANNAETFCFSVK